MGKLNIAHHKSYHPYRRDNIERVRRDEEEARLKEERDEGRMMLADAEARIAMLRDKAGIQTDKKKKRRDDDDLKHIASSSSMQVAALPTTGGHINLFEDLEVKAMVAAIKVPKKGSAETEKGVPLAPSAKDLKPWYSERTKDKGEEVEDDKKRREEFRKSAHDPLTSITKQLASRESSSSSSSRSFKHPSSLPTISDKPPEVRARLSRESSERERALELIRRKKREMDGNATPSTVSGELSSGYGDVFNKLEVEEAHRYRARQKDGERTRYWDDDNRSRDRPHRRW
ncbi:hypothetical protein CPC08DRAFT_722735 [Agrocybe pediades]|nr:hypothetical protein CPC08DRAFT_722735 [Agrocybe pediades]